MKWVFSDSHKLLVFTITCETGTRVDGKVLNGTDVWLACVAPYCHDRLADAFMAEFNVDLKYHRQRPTGVKKMRIQEAVSLDIQSKKELALLARARDNVRDARIRAYKRSKASIDTALMGLSPYIAIAVRTEVAYNDVKRKFRRLTAESFKSSIPKPVMPTFRKAMDQMKRVVAESPLAGVGLPSYKLSEPFNTRTKVGDTFFQPDQVLPIR